MRDSDGLVVVLDGEARLEPDRVWLTEEGWLSCRFEEDEETRIVKLPPGRVERVVATFETGGERG